MAGIVLLNMGGPSGPQEVRPFLHRLFADPMILDLPGGSLLRPVLARTIAAVRAPKVRRLYAQIGGGSPLLYHTRAQARGLAAELERRRSGPARVEVAMRYTAPTARDALRALNGAGETEVVALPLYPQECSATTGSSLDDLEDARRRIAPEMRMRTVRNYHLHEGYLDSMVERIATAIESLPREDRGEAVLLFSAHSVPMRLAKRGDPYVVQIRETVEALMARLGRDRPHRLAFQSRAGPIRWVGPATEEALRELAGSRAVVAVPVSFVSDHIETLYEIDILYAEEARRAGIGRFVRAPALNDSPRFVQALADLVEPAMQEMRTG